VSKGTKVPPDSVQWLDGRITELQTICGRLLGQPKVPYRNNGESIRSKLPEEPGLYAISKKGAPPGEFLRAGRTDDGGLRQRVYQNHLMGSQKGNLRQQLIGSGVCQDLNEAKSWILANCDVQFMVVTDDATRQWAEHFMLSVLRPKYCS
jgi:hypothetical protein